MTGDAMKSKVTGSGFGMYQNKYFNAPYRAAEEATLATLVYERITRLSQSVVNCIFIDWKLNCEVIRPG